MKPIRESLHEAVNRQTVKIAEDGIRSIDTLKTRALRSLARKYGITDVDEFLRCDLFKNAHFVWDGARKVIVRNF